MPFSEHFQSSFIKGFLTASCLIVLTACGGSGGSGSADESTTGGGQPTSRNGLPFADGTDATGVGDADSAGALIRNEHQVRLGLYIFDRSTGERITSITEEDLRITNNDGSFTLSLPDGRILKRIFTDTQPENGAVDAFIEDLDDNNDESKKQFVFTELVSDDFADPTEHVKMFRFLTNINRSFSKDPTQGFFATGFETDPEIFDSIPNETGSVRYVGEIRGFVAGSRGVDRISGVINLTADFADGDILGNVVSDDFGNSLGRGGIDLGLASTNISGNGFSGDLSINECSFGTCTSNSKIEGVFYGPNAEEIGGVMELDITTSSGSIVGAGGYAAISQ